MDAGVSGDIADTSGDESDAAASAVAGSRRMSGRSACAKSKGAGRHKPGAARVSGSSKKKFCRGCRKVQPIVSFAPNQSLDAECKTSVDNLRGLAKRQGQKDWFEKVFGDDKKLAQAIAAYDARCPKTGDEGKRAKSNFKMAELKQQIESSREVLKDAIGKMMNEDKFIAWATTDRAPRLTHTDAKLEFDKMKRNPKAARLAEKREGEIFLGSAQMNK